MPFQTVGMIVLPTEKFFNQNRGYWRFTSCDSQRLLRTAKVRPFIRFFHTTRNRGILKLQLLTIFDKKLIHLIPVIYAVILDFPCSRHIFDLNAAIEYRGQLV